MVTEPEGLTAVLLQIAQVTQQLSDLGHRQADDARQIRDQVRKLAAQVGELKTTVTGHVQALAAVERLDEQVADLAARFDASPPEADSGYQPAAVPQLWKLTGTDLDAAVTRLRAWVDQVYRPGYGYLAAGLPDCWDQHALCLYILDWLSELWSVLYLQPARTTAALAGQAEWHTRLLAAAADQLSRETRRCSHHRDAAWPGARL